MQGEELLSVACEPTGADPEGQCRGMIAALRGAVPSGNDDVSVCITGYGREMAGGGQSTTSEIFANALGTGWAWRKWCEMPQIAERFQGAPRPARQPDKFRTIIDVGGQDSKVITFGAGGIVEGFAMNDRCAAGTGRFLQELAVVLELEDLSELDMLALGSADPAPISSACTVFAESEVVSMLSKGTSKADIAGGIFKAVAERTVELAESLQWRGSVLFDGGTARFDALRTAFERRMGTAVAVPACPQHITAIGAAVYAGRYAEKTHGEGHQ